MSFIDFKLCYTVSLIVFIILFSNQVYTISAYDLTLSFI